MIAAIREQNFNLFSQQLILAEKNLETLKGVLTDKLAKAIQIARQFDVAAKISGAGGGDNVIAFAQDKKNRRQNQTRLAKSRHHSARFARIL